MESSYFTDNNISCLPTTLEGLDYLNISENKLRNFSVARMRRLRHLNANKNELENLPFGVCNIVSLEVHLSVPCSLVVHLIYKIHVKVILR